MYFKQQDTQRQYRAGQGVKYFISAVTLPLWKGWKWWLLSIILVAVGLVPLWAVQYVPIYDYQTHLLEAYVWVRYDSPTLAFAPDYQLRPGWYLRSNALSTLLIAALSHLVAIELAGRLVLSLYVILLIAGLAWLLSFLGRPVWLLLTTPFLVYNLTFTVGMLNWSYGFALLPLALLCYLYWQQRRAGWLLVLLAILVWLIYLAHVLAWGLCLITLCTLAIADNESLPGYFWLCVALLSPIPLLALTRPLFILAPPVIALGLWYSAALIRRYPLRPVTLILLSGTATLLYLGIIKATKSFRLAFLPDVDYSLVAKLVALPRLFSLPHQALPIHWDLVIYNLVLLTLLGLLFGILLWGSLTRFRSQPVTQWRWPVLLGVLLLCYLITPHRTADIVVTEPRIVLLACVIGLAAAPLPPAKSRYRRALIGICLVLAILVPLMTTLYARRYDATARTWAATLAYIPLARQVLVLTHPYSIPESGPYQLVRAAQVLTPEQFTSVYALEGGGFVSNTFFNGPLLPLQPEAIPLYWWTEFDNAAFVRERCHLLLATYDYVVVWNINPSLAQALTDCYNQPAAHQAGLIEIWGPSN